MCTLVRYVSPISGLIRTELLELISLDARNCSAVHVYDAFKNCLISKNIACEKLPRGPEDLLRNISSYCSGSAKRCAQLCEMQDFFHVKRKKILKLASTRWLSMHRCAYDL